MRKNHHFFKMNPLKQSLLYLINFQALVNNHENFQKLIISILLIITKIN